MKGLDQDIKNGRFSRVYLLYGDEDYLRSFYTRKLSCAICDPSDSMNCSRFDGEGTNPKGLIDLAETLPFFKEKRLIVVTDSMFFQKSNDDINALADYLNDACETTVFLFSESKVDKRTKMFKTVSKAGRCVELASPDEKTLTKWAAGILAKNGRKVRESTILRLFDRSGTDMNILKNELDKLIDFTTGRETVDDEDVDAICTVELRNRVFLMIDAVTEHKTRRAFTLYYELLAQKVSPYMILPAIFREFNMMLRVREAAALNSDPSQIARATGIKPFLIKKYMSRSRAFSPVWLRTAMDQCLSLEQEAKSGRLDERLAIELLLYAVSNNKDLTLLSEP